jgi:hypothetical protein
MENTFRDRKQKRRTFTFAIQLEERVTAFTSKLEFICRVIGILSATKIFQIKKILFHETEIHLIRNPACE